MYSLVLNGEPINVSIASLVGKCYLFQTKPELLSKPYTVKSSVSLDSLRLFLGAAGGAVPEITDANVWDLWELCDEFMFSELAKTVGDWQAEHRQIDSLIRRELDLVRAALEERLESQDRMMLMLDRALHREREAAMSEAEKLSIMEAEVSGLRSVLGETAASVQKTARDIDVVRAAVTEQQLAHGGIRTLEEEMGRVGEAIAAVGRSLGEQQGEWKAAIGDLHKKAKQEQSEVSGLKELLGKLEGRYKNLWETVVRQGDELAEIRRHASGLGERVRQLEEENRLLRESSEGLNGQMVRIESGQQSAAARLQEAMAAGASKVKEDFSNVQGELAKMNREIGRLKMVTTRMFFPPWQKKGKAKGPQGGGEVAVDVPDGIIAHLRRECGGNVHDRGVVDVTCGSFARETVGANPHSGVYQNNPGFAAKNAADLEDFEADSRFWSAYRDRPENIPHTRNNWVCYDFKGKRIVPTHYAIRTNNWGGPSGCHLKSWLIETSVDGNSWREVAHEENNGRLNGYLFTATFPVVNGGECRFIRLVQIGRNHHGDDCIEISAWEVFGSLIGKLVE